MSYCEQIKSFFTKELFLKILSSKEEHVDWLETQLGLIEKVGIGNYKQENIVGTT